MSLTSHIAVTTEIDWNNDGDFSDSGEDVSSYVRYPIRISAGRAKSTDEFGAATGAFLLKNPDGRFSPFYTSSPLYPNVLPGRPVRMSVEYDSVSYSLFRGRCTPDSQLASLQEMAMGFTMVDAFEELRLGLTNTALQLNKRVDELLTVIADDIDWPVALRDFDTGLETIGVFSNHNRLPINALQLAAAQDPGSSLFIAKDGKLTWRNRRARSLASTFATLSGTFNKLDPQVRQEDMVDAVRAEYARFSVSAALTAVWTLQTSRRIPSGTSEFDFESSGPAHSYADPVAGTDFTANSQEDGTGTSKTAQLSLSVVASSSGGGTLQAVNLDSSDVWLDAGAVVQGFLAESGGETNVVRATVSSPVLTGQKLSKTFEFQDNEDPVAGWVRWKANTLGSIRMRPVVEITPDTDTLMAVVLGASIGSRIVVTDTGSPWLTQTTGTFILEGYDLEILGPREIRAQWRLFDVDLAIANMFRIGSSAMNGTDRLGY